MFRAAAPRRETPRMSFSEFVNYFISGKGDTEDNLPPSGKVY